MLAMADKVDMSSTNEDVRTRFEIVRQTIDVQSEGLPNGASKLNLSALQDSTVSPADFGHRDYSVWTGIIVDQAESVSISFDRIQQSSLRFPSQVSIAIALLLGCVVILVTPVWVWLVRAAHPIGLVATALLGLSWTIFFSPAIVGWLIALAALCVGVRSMLSRRHQRKVEARDDAMLASQ